MGRLARAGCVALMASVGASLSAWVSPQAAPEPVAGWHVDEAAGVRFPVPFPEAQRKTAAQVTALVLERPEAALPETAHYTSGVYAKGGLPYILVWTRAEPAPPSRSELAELASTRPAAILGRYGFDSLSFDAERMRGTFAVTLRDGLKCVGLWLPARSGSVFIGLYYAEDADRAKLAPLAAGAELAPGQRLTWDELPRGDRGWLRLASAAGAMACAAAATLGVRRWRRRLRTAWP